MNNKFSKDQQINTNVCDNVVGQLIIIHTIGYGTQVQSLLTLEFSRVSLSTNVTCTSVSGITLSSLWIEQPFSIIGYA